MLKTLGNCIGYRELLKRKKYQVKEETTSWNLKRNKEWEEKKRTANKKEDCVKKEDNGNSHSGFLKGKKNFLWEENGKGQIGLKLCELLYDY